MKFSSRISGWPTYILVDQQVKALKGPQSSPNYTSAEAWLRILYYPANRQIGVTGQIPYDPPKVDVISYLRDSTMFNIELINPRVVNDETIYDAYVKVDDYYLSFSPDSPLSILNLTKTPTLINIFMTCGTDGDLNTSRVADGGLFKIGDNKGNYLMITKNSNNNPVLGATDNAKQASPFVFSWTGFKSLKTLITLFLKARYYIDHPKILNNKEQMDEIKQIYSDIGQIIIKEIVGVRVENSYYKDQMTIQEKFDSRMTQYDYNEYNFGPNNPMFSLEPGDVGNPFAVAMGGQYEVGQKGTFPNLSGVWDSRNIISGSQGVTLDDWRHPYPPFAVPPSTLVDRFENQGVDYQRAVTGESSDAAFNEISTENVVDIGIIKNAIKVLGSASIQPSAWDKIQKAVSPIGGFDNVWPSVLIITGNNIGINFSHPIISSSLLGTDPLYFNGPFDGNTRERTSTGISIIKSPDTRTILTDTPLTNLGATNTEDSNKKLIDSATENFGGDNHDAEHMCPIGSGANNSWWVRMFLILLLIIILTISLKSVNDPVENPSYIKTSTEIS